MKRSALLALAALAALPACRDKVLPEPDFERMVRQSKYNVWEPCELFPDGRTMQTPPEGVVDHDRVTNRPELTEGVVNGAYVDTIPAPLTVDTLHQGRRDFEVFCAPCHGVLGDGASRVAAAMTLRKPPSLVGDDARGLAPGRVFQVVTQGYGLMPSFASELPDDAARWAIVGYLRALQRSRGVALTELPPALRARAEEALR